MSLPVRERGLKPFNLASHVSLYMSLPVRERGLKLPLCTPEERWEKVAPRAGAWIETPIVNVLVPMILCRSPCGSVD